MNDLMKTNCYDINDTMIIVGSCMKRMQPKAYEELIKLQEIGCLQTKKELP